jgi:hypothetical protein
MTDNGLAARFWGKVRKTAGCWEWTASISTRGYGSFFHEGRSQPAHRVSWMLENGPIPVGMLVCHHCDNRVCVRPDHLFLGTTKDNTVDAYAKGRLNPRLYDGTLATLAADAQRADPSKRSLGEHHPTAKLTHSQVLDIRSRRAAGESQSDLARAFGIGQSHVSAIVLGKKWRLA